MTGVPNVRYIVTRRADTNFIYEPVFSGMQIDGRGVGGGGGMTGLISGLINQVMGGLEGLTGGGLGCPIDSYYIPCCPEDIDVIIKGKLRGGLDAKRYWPEDAG